MPADRGRAAALDPRSPARGGPAPLAAGLGLIPTPAHVERDDEPETVVDHALPRLGRITRLGPGLDSPLRSGRSGPPREDVDDAKTVVGHRLAEIGGGYDESDDDPATARAADHPAFTAARGAPRPFDPETVQLSRVPLSFLEGGSGDPATVAVSGGRADAAHRWRDESGVDELPPGPLPPGPLPSAVPDQSSPTLARGERPWDPRSGGSPGAPAEATERSESEPGTESGTIDLRAAILVPILGGAVLGVLSVTLILAFVAGWLAM